MMDAPDRLWIDEGGNAWAITIEGGVEYVRVDLYAALEQESARLRETVSGYARAILECVEHEGELCSCCVELLEWCRALAGRGE